MTALGVEITMVASSPHPELIKTKKPSIISLILFIALLLITIKCH